jgi:hypothetical protein
MRELTRERPADCLSDLALDEHLAGEQHAAARANADAHLASCGRCAQRRAQMQAQHAAFLAEIPSLSALAAARTSDVPGPRARILPFAVLSTRAAAAAAVLLNTGLPGLEPPKPGTRSKGAPHIGFFVRRGTKVERGASGQRVQPGDLLRFTYTADRALHLALLDRDRRGASVFFPSVGPGARVSPGSDVALDFSIALDGELGPERIVGVFCPDPFEVEPLRAALAADRALPTAADCTLSEIQLQKDAR